MKRDPIRKILASTLAGALCLCCAGCSTSAADNAKSYFSSVSSILSGLTAGSRPPAPAPSASAGDRSGAIQLDAVTDLTLDENGDYSFMGVEHASFYLIYFCDPSATEDGDDYIYASSPINDTGAERYTGNCDELFRSAYGEYLVKVFAFPEMTDPTYQMSTAASVAHTKTGAQDAPEIDYFWNTNDGTLEMVLTNVDTYTYQAYPETVDVTFTNVEDPGDVVTASITDISAGHYAASTDALTKGKTYSITAVAQAGSGSVTNPVSDVTNVSGGVLFGEVNAISDRYTYSDGWASFPRLVEGFDLNAGGPAGTVSRGFGSGSAEAQASPAAASPGSDWSYDIVIDFGPFSLVGTLELKSDGSAELYEGGGGPVTAGTVYGSWVDNGDGTATISYSPADIKS